MATRTEQEIMKNWKYDGPPLVSVVCITYNHEPYIRDAIEGFLMQETDFPFEIIIHDDASTDRTAEIVKEYAKQYPNLIIPILQSENQYSKGKKASVICFAKARGEYIAICEGDDYWIHPRKIQTQIEALRERKDCELCFHPAFERNERTRKKKIIAKHAKKEKVFSTREVISGDGGFCPTASLVIKRSVVSKMPDWFYKEAPIGDYFWQVYGSLKGGALYLNEPMCIYRTHTNGSWSARMRHIENHIRFNRRFLSTLDNLDRDLSFEYTQEIRHVKAIALYNLASTFLRFKDFGNYQKTISQSWNAKPCANLTQSLMFKVRHFPYLAFVLRKIRDLLV